MGCAKSCNDDSKCRTYTVHTYLCHQPIGPSKPMGYCGTCYLHDSWLSNHGSNYDSGSVGRHDIYSAACRPENSGIASTAMEHSGLSVPSESVDVAFVGVGKAAAGEDQLPELTNSVKR